MLSARHHQRSPGARDSAIATGRRRVGATTVVWLPSRPPRALRMTELAEQLKITRERLSHTLAKMEEQGWVTRRSDPGDKRGQVAVLTDAGAAAIAKAAPGHAAAVRRAVFDRLTPEQVRQFTEITETIVGGLTGDPPWRRR